MGGVVLSPRIPVRRLADEGQTADIQLGLEAHLHSLNLVQDLMPNLGALHPIVVHFVISLLMVGVAFRLVSLTGKLKFTNHAALVLILLGTTASIVAVKSGVDAHGPAERIPGARDAVVHHEELGERTRNIFLGVVALELLALGLVKTRHQRKAFAASAVLGVLGSLVLYETGEHGGELVYDYAGGVGTRDASDLQTENLLIAGLYHQSVQDREAGKHADAARMIEEMVLRRPQDPAVLLLRAQSLVDDLQDGDGALAALERITIADDDQRMKLRVGLARVDAYVAAGLAESATSTLDALKAEFPTNAAVDRRIAEIRGN